MLIVLFFLYIFQKLLFKSKNLSKLLFLLSLLNYRPLQYVRECKTLTGFGPASSVEKYLKTNEDKSKFMRRLHSPAFVLAPSNLKKKIGSDSEAFGSSNERSSVLFVNYCLSEDQHWLLGK